MNAKTSYLRKMFAEYNVEWLTAREIKAAVDKKLAELGRECDIEDIKQTLSYMHRCNMVKRHEIKIPVYHLGTRHGGMVYDKDYRYSLTY